MAKEAVISTGGLNSYGGRVLTEGIDLTQYRKNPLLLWMHRRCFERDDLPLGRVENLRTEGDRLIGTPVFDGNDEFARKIERKWEDGFLRMVSAGVEIMETSSAPEFLLPGQTRHTITKCRLEEVSIVDMGANDDALQLYDGSGKTLHLAAGEESDVLPLLAPDKRQDNQPDNDNDNQTTQSMNKEILQLLGLCDTATEQDALGALRLMKEKSDRADALLSAGIAAAVDGAIAERRITADRRDHFVNLGRSAGLDSLRVTLSLMPPVRKPTELIRPTDGTNGSTSAAPAKLSDIPADRMETFRKEDPAEYERLYRAEYGCDLPRE